MMAKSFKMILTACLFGNQMGHGVQPLQVSGGEGVNLHETYYYCVLLTWTGPRGCDQAVLDIWGLRSFLACLGMPT